MTPVRRFKFEMIDSADRALYAEERETAPDEDQIEVPTEPRKGELTLSMEEYEALGRPDVLEVTVSPAAA